MLEIPRGMEKDRCIVFSDIIPNNCRVHRDFIAQLACLLSCEAPLARSIILEAPHWSLLVYNGDQVSSKFRLLRVLNVVGQCNVVAIIQQYNLRYVACEHLFRENLELPPSISLLWNLQTLISKSKVSPGTVIAPCEIWEMTQLRHLNFYGIRLPDPPPTGQQVGGIVLRHLHTLSTVRDFRLSEEVCKRIPNLKRLKILYKDFSARSSHYCLHNLCRFHKLEAFNCKFLATPKRSEMLQNLIFPNSLRKLSLDSCGCLEWKDLRIIGSLPHLEVLKLSYATRGKVWSPVEGEFLRLKYLKVDACNFGMYSWNADSYHFPVLETLVLVSLPNLDEIPSGIGEIATLRYINVKFCNEFLAISAMKILKEQEDLGNDGLQVRVKFWDERDLKRFRERVEVELESSFTSLNLRVEINKNNY